MPGSMRSRSDRFQARFFPHGILDVFRQIGLFAAAYWAYRLVRGQIGSKSSVAFSNGRQLISLERSTHTFFELNIQHFAERHHWLIDFASWMYVNSHFSITIGSLVFLYAFKNSSFYFIRNMFMVAMFIALVGYFVYPAAPPRFYPEWGFHDSVATFTGISENNVAVNALFNPYAAVPSMHCGFALMLGGSLATLVKFKPLKVFWAAYPIIVSLVVMSTANHYFFDVVTGWLTAIVAALVAHYVLAPARPAIWSFSPPQHAPPARVPSQGPAEAAA
jgi:membrane-associated phospholipid phosphatase